MNNNTQNRNAIRISDVEIIGKFPTWVIKWGNLIITSVFFILLFIAFNIKIPVEIEGDFGIDSNRKCYITIPLMKKDQITDGQNVRIQLKNFSYMEYGYIYGKIDLNDSYKKGTKFHLSIKLEDHSNFIKKDEIPINQLGIGFIVINNDPLIYKIFKFKY